VRESAVTVSAYIYAGRKVESGKYIIDDAATLTTYADHSRRAFGRIGHMISHTRFVMDRKLRPRGQKSN